ncbi:MAG TPA: virulence-associated E family protein [Xanthobacteraceae bacterium]|nr:virulence-associated E family protein [Xanthobacteraceae bacterium]
MMNDHGRPQGNLFNVLHALRHSPEWQGSLAYDEFNNRVLTLQPPPWGGPAVEKWGNVEETSACAWVQQQEIPAAAGTVGRAVQTVAAENHVHPVRDYLNGLIWDGTQRLDNWLTTYLDVEATEYVAAIGPRFLISAVARIFQPGCQVDHMLVLEGPQGRQKSTALRTLARTWFTDRLSPVGTKDSAIEVAGAWLIEMAELDALTKATNSAIKSFVTRREDQFRPPYGKHLIDQPRQCVFAGTINPVGGYLKDPMGARRFWPVACGRIDLSSLERNSNQLWAEAVFCYRAGTKWWLETPLAINARMLIFANLCHLHPRKLRSKNGSSKPPSN